MASVVLRAGPAVANCNLIPAAAAEIPSTQGNVDRSIASPGDTVTLHLDLACHGNAPGFDPVAAANLVSLRFVPPDSTADPSLVTVAPVGAGDVSVANCALLNGRCDTLRLRIPNTDALLAPAGDGRGLTGPAEIVVQRSDGTTLARIGPLYEPTRSCDDTVLNGVFSFFTVLPPPNSFAALANGSIDTALASLDGGGNLVVPFDWSGVLVAPGSPQFRVVQGAGDLDAFPSAPGLPIRVPSSSFVRSFNGEGRPIPPILEVDTEGALILGTADAALSVIRIARVDPSDPKASPIYDLSERLLDGRGPIVIENVRAAARESAPLASLSADASAISFARRESVEGDLNGDGDPDDRVPQGIEIASGQSFATALAATELSVPGQEKPALAAGSGLIAFSVSEARQGRSDLNGDGDVFDEHLRVFKSDGTLLTGALPETPVDADPRIDRRPLGISNGFVFFRTRESDAALRRTELLTPQLRSSKQAGDSLGPSLDAAGRFVAFESAAGGTFLSGAPSGTHVYRLDRATGSYALVDRNAAGKAADKASRHAFIDRSGSRVAFDSAATNLVPNARPGVADVYVRTMATSAITCASCGLPAGVPATRPALADGGALVVFAAGEDYVLADTVHGTLQSLLAGGAAPGFSLRGGPEAASISRDGNTVALRARLVENGSGNVVSDRIWVFDRESGALTPTAASGRNPALSGDGRFAVFQSADALVADDTNGCPDTYVLDWRDGTLERVSVTTEGTETPGSLTEGFSGISDDGRFVAFSDDSGGLLPGAPTTRQVFRYDRTTNTVEVVSVGAGGSFADGAATGVALSGDGRVVAFDSLAANLAACAPAVSNIFARDAAATPSLDADTDTADTVLQVFDATTRVLRNAARVPARVVAVASGRAAFLSSEAEDGGRNGNPASGDTDSLDTIARVYDANTNVLRDLGVAANRIAISEHKVCLTVPELQEAGQDRNGDGDLADDVLAIWDIGAAAGPPISLGVAAEDVAATATGCVFLEPEWAQGAQGSDLNGDGDTDDRVLQVHDAGPGPAALAAAAPTAAELAASEFVARGDVVAFRVCEADQGDADGNGDGDSVDCIMHARRLSTGESFDTQIAASLCTLPGCDPFFEPYRVGVNTVSFLVREEDQSGPGPGLGAACQRTGVVGACDLTGDGDADDVVIAVFALDSGTVQFFRLSDGADPLAQEGPPFPSDVGGRSALSITVPERQTGMDLNGDGIVDDTPVVLLGSDTDGDGTFDRSLGRGDSCVETANPGQVDEDGDGLGDEACDPDPGSILPGALACDLDRDDVIDQHDVTAIFADQGIQPRASDPRDVDADGRISVLDVSLCSRRCTYPNCASAAPPPAPGGCGLTGVEPLGLVAYLIARRCRVRRREREGNHC